MLLEEIDHLATLLTTSHLGTEIVKSPPEKELTNNRECEYVCVCVCMCVYVCVHVCLCICMCV